ncbi:MAG: hypothetical protein IPG47_15075 [Thermoflexaceae bacterium]|jgi:hypothetical protein|nr:hypothetical protein [Thermoflexaceae bacterium]
MTKVVRMLAGRGLAAALGIVALGFAGAFSAHEAQAESPPNPPARFAGSVLVDGVAPVAGTRIEARVGNSTCGVTTTFNASGQSRYVLDVPALDPGATPNCGTDGASVSFWIGDKKAAQSGSWANYQLNQVDLTYTSPTPTPAASASASPSATPRPPTTGGGTAAAGAELGWLFAALGLGALAFGVGGAAVARKGR